MRVHTSWWVVAAVVVVTVVRADLRQQVRLMLTPHKVSIMGSRPSEDPNPSRTPLLTYDELDPSRAGADAFVERTAPHDPELMLAVALGKRDWGERQEVLRHAAEGSRFAPVWEAYCVLLVHSLPSYNSLALWGAHPDDPVNMAENLKQLREEGPPDHLQPETVAPVLQALHSWEAIDPRNALPLVMETKLLHAIGRKAEAFSCWQKAGRLLRVDTYEAAQRAALVKLLQRMGMPEFEAIQAGMGFYPEPSAYTDMRETAHIAQYEGELAVMQGRDTDRAGLVAAHV